MSRGSTSRPGGSPLEPARDHLAHGSGSGRVRRSRRPRPRRRWRESHVARAPPRGSARAPPARPSRLRRARSCRARAWSRGSRRRRSTSPPASAGRTRARGQQRPRVRVQRPVPVLVLGLQRRLDHAGGCVVDEHVERAELGRLLRHPLRGHIASQEQRLGAGGAQLLRGLLGGLVVAQVPDRHAPGAQLGEAERDRLPDPREPPVTRTDAPSNLIAAAGAARPPARRSGSLPSPGRVARHARALARLRRGVAEAVEQVHLVPRRSGAPRGLPGGRARAPRRARVAGRRSAAWPARRARRRRRWLAPA